MSEPKRKLTFQREQGLAKLRLRFDDGTFKLRLSKQRTSYSLGREEAQELALWLSAWSLKLIDDASKADETPKVEAANAEADTPKSRRKKAKANDEGKNKDRKKNGKGKKSVDLAERAIAGDDQVN